MGHISWYHSKDINKMNNKAVKQEKHVYKLNNFKTSILQGILKMYNQKILQNKK